MKLKVALGCHKGMFMVCPSFLLGSVAQFHCVCGLLVLQDRVWRGKTYKNCAIGSEMVDYMITNHWTMSRHIAMHYGQQVCSCMCLRLCVCVCVAHIVCVQLYSLGLRPSEGGDVQFEDHYVFYTFDVRRLSLSACRLCRCLCLCLSACCLTVFPPAAAGGALAQARFAAAQGQGLSFFHCADVRVVLTLRLFSWSG